MAKTSAEFRVKFSLAAKLILSLALLFVLIIGLLSTSAVLLVIEDKQAYTYQLQSMGAYIVSRDFSEKARLGIENLRLYLTSFDPRQKISAQQQQNLEGIVKNQNESMLFASYLVKPGVGVVKNLTKHAHPELIKKYSIQPEQWDVKNEEIQKIYPTLLKDSFAFLNVTQRGKPAALLIAFADVGLKDYAEGMPIAVSYFDLSQLSFSRVVGEASIVSQEGDVLASTNSESVFLKETVSALPTFQAAQAAKFQTGTKEFIIDQKAFLGAFQKTPFGPIILTRIEKRKAMAAAFTLGERLAFMGIISIFVAILFAIVFSNSITKPLKRLMRATSLISKGDFNVDPKVSTSDEVGQLSNSVVIMSKKIQELIQDTAKKEQLQAELRVAAAVQESLIPPPEYKDSQIEIHGSYQSASECGGDWWGYFKHGNKMAIMIADATGHGVPSALITASARSCFSVFLKLVQEKSFMTLSPGEMMSYTNRVVYDAAQTKIMMTFFIGVIDFDAKTITYANAGHNPPWLFKKGESKFTLKSLTPKGERVGEKPEAGNYEEATLPFIPGDILFLYTDGLMENTPPTSKEQYGKKRAKQVVESFLDQGPLAVLEGIKKSYQEYNGPTKHLDDDVTLATIRLL